MDPQAEKTPGLALPKPSSEQGGFFAGPEQGLSSPEAGFSAAEVGPLPAGAPPIVAPQMPAMPVPAVSQPTGLPVDPAAAQVPSSDDDSSALDEEWINKAKAIVEQTKHDPRLESTELSKVKADYLRIRYNKHIKVAEEGK